MPPTSPLQPLNPTKRPLETIAELVRLARQPGIVRLARRYSVSQQTLYHYLDTRAEAPMGRARGRLMSRADWDAAATMARQVMGLPAVGRPIDDAAETALRLARLVRDAGLVPIAASRGCL
jgi:transposase-like protein